MEDVLALSATFPGQDSFDDVDDVDDSVNVDDGDD